MTATYSRIASTDHIDLLLSAAVEYQLLPDPAAAAVGSHLQPLLTATVVTDLGHQLQQANRNALAQTGSAPAKAPYGFASVPVGAIAPIEIVKAVHAMEHLCQGSPGWAFSAAYQFLRDLERAATQRVPGYADAAWQWSRENLRTGPPIGVARGWKPAGVEDVMWVTATQARAQWDSAHLIVVTLDTITAMDGMTPRPAIFLAVDREMKAEVWSKTEGLSFQPDRVLIFPTAIDWLHHHVRSDRP